MAKVTEREESLPILEQPPSVSSFSGIIQLLFTNKKWACFGRHSCWELRILLSCRRGEFLRNLRTTVSLQLNRSAAARIPATTIVWRLFARHRSGGRPLKELFFSRGQLGLLHSCESVDYRRWKTHWFKERLPMFRGSKWIVPYAILRSLP